MRMRLRLDCWVFRPPQVVGALILPLLVVAMGIATAAAQPRSGSEQDASGETNVQRCVRAPTRICVLELARTLANTPGLLSAAERERFEAEVIYADRPERLLANGPPQVDLGADWPTIDRELINALVTANRFAEATAILDRWIGQLGRHDSKFVSDAFVPVLVRARAVINCLQSSTAQCASSLRAGFGAHAMYVTDNATGLSGCSLARLTSSSTGSWHISRAGAGSAISLRCLRERKPSLESCWKPSSMPTRPRPWRKPGSCGSGPMGVG